MSAYLNLRVAVSIPTSVPVEGYQFNPPSQGVGSVE